MVGGILESPLLSQMVLLGFNYIWFCSNLQEVFEILAQRTMRNPVMP
jgi:hypothetical protein